MYKNQLLSIYPIYNSLQIDKLYENYLKQFLEDPKWNFKDKNYINKVKKYYYEYQKYIKNLKFDNYPIKQSNENLLIFYKNFLETIFNEISIKPYLCNNAIKITNKNKETIYRPNHGSLNHLRSICFTNILMIMLKQEKYYVYKDLCPTKNHEFLLLISSLFKSILRNDEGNQCSGFIQISDEIINSHFPNIAQYLTVFISGMKITLFHLASGILLKSIIKHLNIKGITDEFIEMLVFGNIYYLNVHNSKITDYFNLKDSTANNFEYKIGNNEYKILLIYCIVCTGHYLDHCRLGSFGGILNQPHISILRKTINTSIDQDEYIIENVLSKLYFTEFLEKKKSNQKFDIEIKKCVEPKKDQYNFYKSARKSSDCCGELFNRGIGKKDRYTNKFFEISKNFNKIYTELSLESYFNKLLK